jgi:hypothetical protein
MCVAPKLVLIPDPTLFICVHQAAILALVARGGYLVELADGLCLAAFGQPAAAMLWALEVQTALRDADWPEELLQHEAGEEIAVFVAAPQPAPAPVGAALTRTSSRVSAQASNQTIKPSMLSAAVSPEGFSTMSMMGYQVRTSDAAVSTLPALVIARGTNGGASASPSYGGSVGGSMRVSAAGHGTQQPGASRPSKLTASPTMVRQVLMRGLRLKVSCRVLLQPCKHMRGHSASHVLYIWYIYIICIVLYCWIYSTVYSIYTILPLELPLYCSPVYASSEMIWPSEYTRRYYTHMQSCMRLNVHPCLACRLVWTLAG